MRRSLVGRHLKPQWRYYRGSVLWPREFSRTRLSGSQLSWPTLAKIRSGLVPMFHRWENLATPLGVCSSQGQILPVRLGRAISAMCGSQASLQVHYCTTDEVVFTILLWQNNGRHIGLKSLGNKITFVGFRGAIAPIPPGSAPISSTRLLAAAEEARLSPSRDVVL